MSIDGRAWMPEGTEVNKFNVVFGAWLGARIFHRRSLHQLSLQAAPSYRPIAFGPEGLPVNRCHA